ncbi:MAG: TetR/AcrR family transcriptional regulator, partial [Candidatus Ornithospirochaeta sp.]
MNEKFNRIDEEKRRAMINSGFRNFSRFGYRKASMADIAKDAGVSKALFFHYFETKREFFLYLWNFTAEETMKALEKSAVGRERDFFSMMEKGLKAKMDLARQWPGMALFAVKAYYERDEEVSGEISRTTDPFLNADGNLLITMFPSTPFRDDLDL